MVQINLKTDVLFAANSAICGTNAPRSVALRTMILINLEPFVPIAKKLDTKRRIVLSKLVLKLKVTVKTNIK